MDRLRAEIALGRRALPALVRALVPALVLACVAGIAYAAEPSPSAPGAPDYAAHCANCHGAQLQGGVHAPPLVGPVFEQNWAGKRARLFYSRIISTMPQNDPGTLTVPQALAVTLYVFAANGVTFAGHPVSSPDDLNTLTIPQGAAAANATK